MQNHKQQQQQKREKRNPKVLLNKKIINDDDGDKCLQYMQQVLAKEKIYIAFHSLIFFFLIVSTLTI